MEVIEFLQGEWTNAEDSSENYFVMGTSVRRINSKGTKTFEKHLQWEDKWKAISWGTSQRYYLDTPQPKDQVVRWSAYKKGGKAFRWYRPKSWEDGNAQTQTPPLKPQPKARPKSKPQEHKEPLKLVPKSKRRPKPPENEPKAEGASDPAEGTPAIEAEAPDGSGRAGTEPEVPGKAKEQVEVELAEVAEVVEIMCGESKVTPVADENLLGADPGWEKERLMARRLLSRGFRPKANAEEVDQDAVCLIEDEPEGPEAKRLRTGDEH